MTLSEFKEKTNEPAITNPASIELLFALFYNMDIEEMYCKGLWSESNPFANDYKEYPPVSGEKPTYSTVVKEIFSNEKNSSENKQVFNDMIRLISDEHHGFTSLKYYYRKEK